MKRTPTTYSIFGQCEAAAAQVLIDAGKATKIPADQIPASAAKNDEGTPARFAIVVPARHVREFEKLCADLRA